MPNMGVGVMPEKDKIPGTLFINTSFYAIATSVCLILRKSNSLYLIIIYTRQHGTILNLYNMT